MAYQALYRKWRPLIFDDVIGQSHVTATIKNEIIQDKICHAYLFTGTRGTGKTSTAKILSRAINCLNPKDGNPCNECEHCKGILNETIFDVVEMDAASNTGVDNIREIIEQVQYSTGVVKYRVYIIDEVHMLSTGAFNALLKTLEEPPQNVVFILATTEVHKIPATILSRCQRFDFKSIGVNDIADRIKVILKNESFTVTDEAVEYVATLGDGSMRDSLSIMDRCLSFKTDNLTYEDVVEIVGTLDNKMLYSIADSIADESISTVVEIFEKAVLEGKNLDGFSEALLSVYRELLVAKVNGEFIGSSRNAPVINSISAKYTNEKILNCINILSELDNNLKYAVSKRIMIEVALVRMAKPQLSTDTNALLDRIAKLEKMIENGTLVQTSTPVKVQPDAKCEDDDLPWYTDDEVKPEAEIKEENNAEQDNAEECINAKEEYNEPETKDAEIAATNAPTGKNVLTVISRWNEFCDSITIKNMILCIKLLTAKPIADGDTLVIEFGDADTKKEVEAKSNMDNLKGYLQEFFGFSLDISCRVKGESAAAQNSRDIFDIINENQ